MTAFNWRHAWLSDVGRVRADNEDSVFVAPEAGTFVLADGMGGHRAGEVASRLAAETIGQWLTDEGRAGSFRERRAFITAAFAEAGRQIVLAESREPAYRGMGTTATALHLSGAGGYVVGHIGDSRAYRFRGGELERLTRDHSWVQEQVDSGLIPPERAWGHPRSHLLTRALSAVESPVPDLYDGELRNGDLFLLASDGLTDMLPDPRIDAVLQEYEEIEEAAARLVEEANAAGGADNVTVLLVRVSVQ